MGWGEQPEFVEDTALKEDPDERGAVADGDVSRLRFQVPQLLCRVIVDECRVLPVD
jgi:hypothetical protein